MVKETLASPIVIALWNNLAYNGAFTLLLHLFSPARLRRYMLFFAILTVICLVFNNYSAVFNLAFVPTGMLLLWKQEKSLWFAAVKSATAVSFLLIVGLALGSTIAIALPELFVRPGFNYVMGAGEVLAAFLAAVLLHRKTLFPRDVPAVYVYVFVPECLVVLMYALVVPRLQVANLTNLSIASIFVVTGSACMAALAHAHLKTALEARKHELQLAYERQYWLDRVRYTGEIARMGHFYQNLYYGLYGSILHGDLIAARDYVERFIKPVHDSVFLATETEQIEDEILRGYIEGLMAQGPALYPGIVLQMSIFGRIRYAKELALPVMKLVSVFIGNAIQALERQGGGQMSIHLYGDAEEVHIRVGNTVPEGFTKFDLHCKSDNRILPHGLDIVREIMESEPDITLDTEVKQRDHAVWLTQSIHIRQH